MLTRRGFFTVLAGAVLAPVVTLLEPPLAIRPHTVHTFDFAVDTFEITALDPNAVRQAAKALAACGRFVTTI